MKSASQEINFGLVGLSLAVGGVVVWFVREININLRRGRRHGGRRRAGGQRGGQVSSSSQSLAQGASEQAASLEETSASSEEINSMARRNTENSHRPRSW